MNRIAEEVEARPDSTARIISAQRAEPEATGADAIAAAARQIAETLDLAAIVCWTSSGSTGAARRARAAASRRSSRCRRTSTPARRCRWCGACIASSPRTRTTIDDMVDRACRIAFKEGFAKAGERVIIVCGVPLGTPGATNMLRIAFVGGEDVGD